MTKTDSGVVIGSGEGARSHISRKMTLLIVGLLAVVCLVVGILYTYLHHQHDQAVQKQVQMQAGRAAEAKLPGQDLQSKVNAGLASGKYDQTLAMLQAQTPNDTHEVQGYIAVVYVAKGDYQNALDKYARIETKYGLTRSEAAYAGMAAQNLKQKDLAIKYYTEAKNLAAKETNNPLKESNIQEYSRDIEAAQKL